MSRFVLARHGESVFSAEGLLNGDPSVPGGLTPAGVAQARALGELLRAEPLELVVTSAFERAIATADEATRGRGLPRVVIPELGDPRYGPFEGGSIEAYRAWAATSPSTVAPGEGAESRFAIVERYTRAYRRLLERPEETVLVVGHSLPVSYALAARDRKPPSARMPFAEYATPYTFTFEELETVVVVLEAWLETPTF